MLQRFATDEIVACIFAVIAVLTTFSILSFTIANTPSCTGAFFYGTTTNVTITIAIGVDDVTMVFGHAVFASTPGIDGIMRHTIAVRTGATSVTVFGDNKGQHSNKHKDLHGNINP